MKIFHSAVFSSMTSFSLIAIQMKLFRLSDLLKRSFYLLSLIVACTMRSISLSVRLIWTCSAWGVCRSKNSSRRFAPAAWRISSGFCIRKTDRPFALAQISATASMVLLPGLGHIDRFLGDINYFYSIRYNRTGNARKQATPEQDQNKQEAAHEIECNRTD